MRQIFPRMIQFFCLIWIQTQKHSNCAFVMRQQMPVFVAIGMVFLWAIPLVSAQEIPKGYEKFEAEDLSFFRKKVSFQDPMLHQITFPDTTQKGGRPVTGKDTLITVHYDFGPEIESLLERHKNMDQHHQEKMVKGFRIQLYAGLDRGAADKIKVDFLAIWPDVQVFQTYSRPTFKVRAGNFLTRTEAEMFCQRVKNHFTGAFVVPELIQLNRKENPYEAPPSSQGDR